MKGVRVDGFFSEKALFRAGLFVLIAFLSPYWTGYSNATFLIHDSLNGNIVFNEILINSSKVLASSMEPIDGFMGGLERGVMKSKLSILLWLQYILGGEWSYRFLVVVVHIIAYLSMNMWLKKCAAFTQEDSPLLRIGVSVLFGLLPFWPHAGLAIAGMPLLFYSFSNFSFEKRPEPLDVFIVTLFPFASGFFISNLFVVVTFGVFLAAYALYRRSILWKGALWLIIFMAFTILAEHQLVDVILFKDFVSQRASQTAYVLNTFGFIGVAMKLFFLGQYHAHSDFIWFLPLLFLGLGYMVVTKRRIWVLLVAIFVVMAGLVSLHEFFNWQVVHSYVPFLAKKSIQPRFYALMPLIWHTGLFISIVPLAKWKPYLGVALSVILMAVMVNRVWNVAVFDYRGANYAENSFASTWKKSDPKKYSTFDDYYLSSTVVTLDNKHAVLNGEPVGCIGFEPQRVQYQGVITVGGYYPVYRADFQKEFSEMIFGNAQPESLSRIGRACYLDLAFEGGSEVSKTLNIHELNDVGCKLILATRIVDLSPHYSLIDSILVVENSPYERVYVYGN